MNHTDRISNQYLQVAVNSIHIHSHSCDIFLAVCSLVVTDLVEGWGGGWGVGQRKNPSSFIVDSIKGADSGFSSLSFTLQDRASAWQSHALS